MPRTILPPSTLVSAQKQVDAIQRRGAIAARKVTAAIKRIVLSQIAGGHTPTLALEMFVRILPTLTDGMVAAHLVGLKTRQPTLALSVFDKTIDALKRGLKVNINQLQRQYQTQALRILNDVTLSVEKELRTEFLLILEAGDAGPRAKQRIRDKFDSLGLTDKSDHQIETIFRTQSQIAYGAGRWEADQDPDIQEILWGYEYSAVMDDRTRLEHAALNGTKLPKEDPFWQKFWPPNGYNCRCVAIPIFEEVRTVRPPPDLQPDKGFDFNPGLVFQAAR